MNFSYCPVCGTSYKQLPEGRECNVCGYCVHNNCIRFSDSIELARRKRNLMYEWLIRNNDKRHSRYYTFYYYDNYMDHSEDNINSAESSDMINIALLLRKYPQTLLQRIDEIMINIMTLNNDMGVFFPISFRDEELMYCETDNPESEISYLVNMMKELGYIIFEEDSLDDSIFRCQITLAGWKKIEELTTEKSETNQAFIAMKFGEITKDIATAIKTAISTMGYIPYKMDEREHNNQIIPEMFYEISKSKMLITDVTVPNLGAYYEAGYAQALGKEVIVCCKSTETGKAHFDISQKNMILWNDYDELVRKLSKRIEATVGRA